MKMCKVLLYVLHVNMTDYPRVMLRQNYIYCTAVFETVRSGSPIINHKKNNHNGLF